MLVGDTQQLPASVLSHTAQQNGFNMSLFSRIQKCFEDTGYSACNTLLTQYRMHPEICRFPNKYFYKMKLITDESTIEPNFKLKPYTVFNLDCLQDPTDNFEFSNSDEAMFIRNLVTALVYELKPNLYTFGVVTPYRSQKILIDKSLNHLKDESINVNTIDSYQGQEMDIIIVCTTRTIGVGFLADSERLNVALTRAKHCLIVCGNFVSIRERPVWSSLINDAKHREVYHELSTKEYNVKDILSFVKK